MMHATNEEVAGYGGRSTASAPTSVSTSIMQAEVIWKAPSSFVTSEDEENFSDNHQQREQVQKAEDNDSEKNKCCTRDRALFITLYVLLLLSLSGLAFAITRYTKARIRNKGNPPSPQENSTIASDTGNNGTNPMPTLEEIDPNRDPIKYRSDIELILSTVVEYSNLLRGPQKDAIDWLVYDDLVLTSTEIEAMMTSLENNDNNDVAGGDSGDDVPIFPLVQRYALMVLFFGTNGELWADTPWSELTTFNECKFAGVRCSSTGNDEGQVDVLDLEYRKLRGRLPDETGLLTKLTTANFQANNLDGSIPSFIFNKMTDLETLDLSGNFFSSSISSDISNLTKLKSLYLNELSLTGSLPESLKLVSTLETLQIFHGTLMKGPILNFLEYWPNLYHIDLYQSSFTGTIPTSIGINTNLWRLWLKGNLWNVTDLPTELGLLTDLQSLGISTRIELAGGATIPTEFGQMTAMEILDLKGKDYRGTIPTEMGRLTQLSYLTLHGEFLTGTIPSELGLLTSLAELQLAGNKFEGTLPSEIGNLTLDMLELYRNDITGSIPEGLCSNQFITIKRDCQVECSCCYWPCHHNIN